MIPSWLILSVITAVCWGIMVTLFKKSYASYPPGTMTVLGTITALVVLFPFALMNHAHLIFWPLIPVAILNAPSYVFYFYALEKGKLALTGTTLASYPLFTVVLAVAFIHESLAVLTVAGIAAIVFGLVLLSTENPSRLLKTKPGTWLWWGLAGAALSGFGDFVAKVMVSNYDVYSYLLAFVVGWVVVGILALAFDKRQSFPTTIDRGFIYLVLAELLLFVGYILLFIALKTGKASIVTPISASYSLIALALALVWLREKISRYQMLGAFGIILGVILVSRG